MELGLLFLFGLTITSTAGSSPVRRAVSNWAPKTSLSRAWVQNPAAPAVLPNLRGCTAPHRAAPSNGVTVLVNRSESFPGAPCSGSRCGRGCRARGCRGVAERCSCLPAAQGPPRLGPAPCRRAEIRARRRWGRSSGRRAERRRCRAAAGPRRTAGFCGAEHGAALATPTKTRSASTTATSTSSGSTPPRGLCHMGSPTIEAALEAKDLQARIKALPSLHFGALVWTSMTNSVCSFAEECKTEEEITDQ